MFKFISISIISCCFISAQDIDGEQLKVQLRGGINYLFNDEQLNYFGEYQEINRKRPGFSIGLNLNYSLNTSSSLFLSVEYIESETTAKNSSSSTDWISNGYPISIGYQYNFSKLNEYLYPYISTDVSFYISTEKITKENITGLTENYERTENGFGVDGNLGLIYQLSSKIEILTELKLRYANASLFTEESKYASIEFSGIYFYFGIDYNFS